VTDGSPVIDIARIVLDRLAASGSTLAVAESLTGGLVVATLVAVPGASTVLRGGVVAYATDLKHTLLGVDADLLARVGPVDPEVAEAMAQGARGRLGATYGVATTGVAGPDPQNGIAVGTVIVAVAGPSGTRVETSEAVPGSRGEVRAWTVDRVLSLLREELEVESFDPPGPPIRRVTELTGTVDPP
jgi:nicotinamide-nucleotide amidase